LPTSEHRHQLKEYNKVAMVPKKCPSSDLHVRTSFQRDSSYLDALRGGGGVGGVKVPKNASSFEKSIPYWHCWKSTPPTMMPQWVESIFFTTPHFR
jgi:hypothetical protein